MAVGVAEQGMFGKNAGGDAKDQTEVAAKCPPHGPYTGRREAGYRLGAKNILQHPAF